AAAGELPVVRERLDNGVTLLVRANPAAPVVAVSLLVRMGTRWETPADAGLSNFVQAVMVTGTVKRNGGEIAETITGLGGRLYGPHPYGLPTLGTPESLARIDQAAIVAWYRRFYRPERMVLGVSGQVPAAEVMAEARRLFGGLPRGGTAEDAPLAPPKPAGGRTVVEQASQQTQILVGTLAPRVADRDYAAVKLLGTVLGGGQAGRLFAELRDKQALAYTAAAFFDPLREPGSFLVYIVTSPGNAARAGEALRREIERIRAERVSAPVLLGAKAYLLGTFEMDRRTNARQAWYLAFFETLGVGHDFPARYHAAVEAVTAEDLLRV